MRALIQQCQRFLDWEVDVTAQVVSSLHGVPSDIHPTEPWQKAVTILGHLAAARQVWLFRLGKFPTKPTVLFPTDLRLEQIESQFAEVFAAWQTYLAELTDDAALDGQVEYQSFDGSRFRSSIGDIIAQLTTHGAYHRGQLASLVKACGGTPAITDFIFWSRESIA